MAKNLSNGWGVSALVVGIIAILLAWTGIVGLILGLLAVIFGFIALAKRQSKAMGLVGIILGVISTVIAFLILFLGATFFASVLNQVNQSNGNSSVNDNINPTERVVAGTAITLGVGTYQSLADIQPGLYDVTPGADQSGTIAVTGADTYNETLGADITDNAVPKIRMQITDGDTITIAGLSAVTFTPVKAAFVDVHQTIGLYTGTFIVGQDIGAGKYTVTSGADKSGTITVTAENGTAEPKKTVLGSDTAAGQVTSTDITVTNGDIIQISGIPSATFSVE